MAVLGERRKPQKMKINELFPEWHPKESEEAWEHLGITERGSSTRTRLLQVLCCLSRTGTNSNHYKRRSHQDRAIIFSLFFLPFSSLPCPSGLPPLFSKFCNTFLLLAYSCFSLCLLTPPPLSLSEHPRVSSFQSFYTLYLTLSCCLCSMLR